MSSCTIQYSVVHLMQRSTRLMSQGQQQAVDDDQPGVGGEGGGEMLTARLLTNCSLYTIHVLTPERIPQGHVQKGRRATFSWPILYMCILLVY